MTQEEFDQLVVAVTAAIMNKSSDPGQYELAESLSGITSLPALHEVSGVFTLKRVLISSLKGDRGNPFVYSDFTESELADLRLTWDKLTPEQKESLKLKFADLTSEDKEEIKGDQGNPFTYDDFTESELADLRLTWDKLTPEQKDSLKLHFNELTAEEKEEIKGDSGVQIVNDLSEADESSRVVIVQTGEESGNWEKEW
ncbi:MAG: hypothetical protein PHG27_09820 [Massilibacteroides sp.]|nr:hypothetical protein [Massilibacteroides sp.]